MREQGSKLKKLVSIPWDPKPVELPVPHEKLGELDPLTRSAESIRYSILSIEFWVSNDGQVREWLRHNGRLALVLAIPVLAVLPLITFALGQLVAWMSALVSISGKLIVLPLLALVALFALLVVVGIIRWLFGGNR